MSNVLCMWPVYKLAVLPCSLVWMLLVFRSTVQCQFLLYRHVFSWFSSQSMYTNRILMLILEINIFMEQFFSSFFRMFLKVSFNDAVSRVCGMELTTRVRLLLRLRWVEPHPSFPLCVHGVDTDKFSSLNEEIFSLRSPCSLHACARVCVCVSPLFNFGINDFCLICCYVPQ
jgi:hypothetical protein